MELTTNVRLMKGGNKLQNFNLLTVSTGAFGAVASFLFGEWDVLIEVLLWMMIVDYGSGMVAAIAEGKTGEGGLSSKQGFKGIARKVLILALVAIGSKIDLAIGDGSAIRNTIIFFYMGNELLSLIENVGRVGLPVPDALRNAVTVLRNRGGESKDKRKGA